MLLVLVVWLGACATRKTESDDAFGSSVGNNSELMVAKGNQLAEPRGLEGPTAVGVVENYHYNQGSEVQEQTREGRGLLKYREQ